MAHELPNDADWSMTNTRNLQCPLKFKPISTTKFRTWRCFLGALHYPRLQIYVKDLLAKFHAMHLKKTFMECSSLLSFKRSLLDQVCLFRVVQSIFHSTHQEVQPNTENYILQLVYTWLDHRKRFPDPITLFHQVLVRSS